jgi:hypothetical protein
VTHITMASSCQEGNLITYMHSGIPTRTSSCQQLEAQHTQHFITQQCMNPTQTHHSTAHTHTHICHTRRDTHTHTHKHTHTYPPPHATHTPAKLIPCGTVVLHGLLDMQTRFNRKQKTDGGAWPDSSRRICKTPQYRETCDLVHDGVARTRS